MNTLTIKAFEAIQPNNNPKLEINHILVDNINIVVTDTTMLLIKPHNLKVDENMLLVNDKAKFKIDTEDLFNGFKVNKNRADGYPNYKRIIPTGDYIMFNAPMSFIDALYTVTYNHSILFDYIKMSTIFKKLDKNLSKVVSYNFKDKNLPLCLKFEDGEIFVIMPLNM